MFLKSILLTTFFFTVSSGLFAHNDEAFKSINNTAPVTCKKSIIISASSEKVWAIMTNINNWSTWQTDISNAKLHGELKPSTTFDWKTGGVKIHSTLHTVAPFERFGWTGKSLGMFAIHNWTISEKDGSTMVSVEESMEGLMARLLKRSLDKSLEQGMEQWLNLLKLECEKQETL